MAGVGPIAKGAARTAARYGPHALVVWNVAGEHVQAAARSKAAELAERRKAFDEADSTANGSVLRVVHRGTKYHVVFAGDEPISSYPATHEPLEHLIAHADLGKRVTPVEHRESSVRARAKRAGNRAGNKVRRRPGPAELG